METLKAILRRVNPQWITYGVTLIVGGLVGLLFQWLQIPTPPAPDRPVVPIFVSPAADENDVAHAAEQIEQSGGTPEVFRTGWVDQPEQVQAIAARLPFKVFSDTPAGKAEDPLPKSAYLWQAYEQLFARPPPCKNQNPIGACVSFGTNTAIERTMACEIAILKRPFQFKHIAEEVTYAGSRVEIGKGRLGRGDGSVGAWAAQFVQQYGVVPREKVGNYDLSSYDPSRCRSWGSSGVPSDLEPVAREHPVKEITRIANWEEAKKALANGYGIAVCSNQGFAAQRDGNGVCRPSGSWAHCMALDGYHTDSDGKEYGHIENSWGNSYHKGPVGWGNPTTAGFWTSAATIDRMLRQGDSWAFSGVQGFPKRRNVIDWFAKGPALPNDLEYVALPKPHTERQRMPVGPELAPMPRVAADTCGCGPRCTCDSERCRCLFARRDEPEFALAP